MNNFREYEIIQTDKGLFTYQNKKGWKCRLRWNTPVEAYIYATKKLRGSYILSVPAELFD